MPLLFRKSELQLRADRLFLVPVPHFAKALLALLEKHGWTQRAFASMTGLEQNEVSNYVRGKHGPKVKHLKSMLSAAGNDDRDLLLGYLRDNTPAEFHSRIHVDRR